MFVLSQNKHVYPTKEYFSLTKKYFSHLYRIKTLFKKKKKSNILYSSINYAYKVGDGLSIRLCHDIWCGDSALKYSFLKFFSLTHNKEALVSE
jgi:hypothetical protein